MSTILIANKELKPVDYPIGFNMKHNLIFIRELIKTFSLHKGNENKLINIFCMGSSGAIVSTIFALELLDNCRIQHIKKVGEQCHYAALDLHRGDNVLNIIVDDIIDSGSTVNAIYEKISSRYSINIVDYVCVTGTVAQAKLSFFPKYLICQGERGY